MLHERITTRAAVVGMAWSMVSFDCFADRSVGSLGSVSTGEDTSTAADGDLDTTGSTQGEGDESLGERWVWWAPQNATLSDIVVLSDDSIVVSGAFESSGGYWRLRPPAQDTEFVPVAMTSRVDAVAAREGSEFVLGGGGTTGGRIVAFSASEQVQWSTVIPTTNSFVRDLDVTGGGEVWFIDEHPTSDGAAAHVGVLEASGNVRWQLEQAFAGVAIAGNAVSGMGASRYGAFDVAWYSALNGSSNSSASSVPGQGLVRLDGDRAAIFEASELGLASIRTWDLDHSGPSSESATYDAGFASPNVAAHASTADRLWLCGVAADTSQPTAVVPRLVLLDLAGTVLMSHDLHGFAVAPQTITACAAMAGDDSRLFAMGSAVGPQGTSHWVAGIEQP